MNDSSDDYIYFSFSISELFETQGCCSTNILKCVKKTIVNMGKFSGALFLVAIFTFAVLACEGQQTRPGPLPTPRRINPVPIGPQKRLPREAENEIVEAEELSTLERVRREPGRPGNMPKPRPLPIKPRPPHPRLRREAEEESDDFEEIAEPEEALSTLERVRREPGRPGNMPKPRPLPIKPRPPHPRLRREAEEESDDFKEIAEPEEALSTLERVRREPGRPGNMPKPRPLPIKPRPPHPRL